MEFVAKAFLPTKFGEFEVLAFRCHDGEHLALVKGKLGETANVRIHSKCLTGDTLCSLRCDCREQLEASLKYISKNDGVLVYLDQEGRGIGLANKIKAYALQDEGYDTIEANKKLGFGEDERDFSVAAMILGYLKIKKVRLLTNNPKKIKSMEDAKLQVIERIPVLIKPNKHNKKYIDTKAKKMKHFIE